MSWLSSRPYTYIAEFSAHIGLQQARVNKQNNNFHLNVLTFVRTVAI